MKLHYQTIWQDPLGIFFFPEKFQGETGGGWHQYPYKFIVEFPSDMRVLDFAKTDKKERLDILKKANGGVDYRDEKDFTPHRFWDSLREIFNVRGGMSGEKARMSNFLRKLGYDAIFDDTNEIYHGETQLILINPAVKYKVVDVVRRSGSGWNEVAQVAKIAAELCKPFGKITMGKQKQAFSGWDQEVRSTVTFHVNEHLHDQGPWAFWEVNSQRHDSISHSPVATGISGYTMQDGVPRKKKSKSFPDQIYVHLKYSNPSGPGESDGRGWEKRYSDQYGLASTTIETRHMDFTELKQNVPAMMQEIWERHAELQKEKEKELQSV